MTSHNSDTFSTIRNINGYSYHGNCLGNDFTIENISSKNQITITCADYSLTIINKGMIYADFSLKGPDKNLSARMKVNHENKYSGEISVDNGERYLWNYDIEDQKLKIKNYLDENLVFSAYQDHQKDIHTENIQRISCNIEVLTFLSIYYFINQFEN